MLSIVSLILTAALAADAPAPSKLGIENCDFGETYAFNAAECQIALSNDGDKPIRVFDIKPSKTGDAIEPAQITLEAHATAYLRAKVYTGNAAAGSRHSFRFRTDEAGHEDRIASANGFVLSALDQAKPELDFAVVEADVAMPQKSIDLGSHESAGFRITRILEKPAYLDVTLAPDGHGLTATFRADAEWGLHLDYIKLAIDTPQQKEAWITVRADFHGGVVASFNPFEMGLMRYGGHNEHRIALTSRSGKDFKIGKVDLEGVKGETKILPCQPEASGCKTIDLTVSDQQPAGAIEGKVWIEFPDYHQRMKLAVWGLILAPDVKVKSLDQNHSSSSGDGDASAPGPQKSSETKAPIDLHQALRSVIRQADDVAPPGTGPLLKWTVANGVQIYGFQVFRSDREAGPFVLVNKSTIKSVVVDEAPASYQWRDASAESGKVYWYYIGLVNRDGTKQQLSGPQKVVAK